MTSLLSVFQIQLRQIKNNIALSLLLVLTTTSVLFIGHYNGHFLQGLIYLLVIWVCSVFIDLFALLKPPTGDFPVRNPGRETIYVSICTILGFLFLFIRFTGDWEHINGLIRLLTLPLLLCSFPIALAAILLLLKYRPKDLGFRLQGIATAFPVVAILAMSTYLVAPENVKWKEMISQEGITGLLFTSFISAALAEEFWRVIAQSRFAGFFRNNGIGWFMATVIWALMHTPKWYADSKNITDTLLSSVRIIPIGLMWGYLTYKTKSMLPSILVHGTNLWGLQNF